jgi:uncharacterized protein (DUF1810 family)
MDDLQRFVDAQDQVYQQVVAELRAGRKRSHWMWFVFPQAVGLGFSAMAMRYAIGSLTEAKAYLRHPIMGPRLHECTRLVMAFDGRSIRDILGSPDDMKFRSCMTLFAQATDDKGLFSAALTKYFGGAPDQRTLEILRGSSPPA